MIFGDFLDFKGETSVISGRRNLESQVFNLEKDFVSQGHTLWPYPRRWGGGRKLLETTETRIMGIQGYP